MRAAISKLNCMHINEGLSHALSLCPLDLRANRKNLNFEDVFHLEHDAEDELSPEAHLEEAHANGEGVEALGRAVNHIRIHEHADMP